MRYDELSPADQAYYDSRPGPAPSAYGYQPRTQPGSNGNNGHHTDEPADSEDDWAAIDLVPIAHQIAAGTRQRELPTLLEVTDTIGLLYPGRTHSIFGLPGGGKTWVALVAIAEQVRHNRPALFIDWEDNADSTAARLLMLGCQPDQLACVDYISPTTALTFGIQALNELGAQRLWELVVIDSAGEAMAAGGTDPNLDGQVATWMTVAKSLTRLESAPAVLMLDHVPKAEDAPAGFAIGSQRKLAAITGASYRCETLVEPAIGVAGKLKLVVAKDRIGNRRKGMTAAEVHFEPVAPDDETLTIVLHQSAAQIAHDRGERFRPTVLMERISRWLELHPGSSGRTITSEVSGRRETLVVALDVLHEEGWVAAVDGPRRSSLYTVARPYREDAETVDNPVDNVSDSVSDSSGSQWFPVVPGTSGKGGSVVPERQSPPQGGDFREPLTPSDPGTAQPDEWFPDPKELF
jgi:hypothetical protein